MKILIIDDDQDLLAFLDSNLSARGLVVTTTKNGKDGSYAACNNDYDLVILDLNLPQKNGRQICQEIRQVGKTMPILMLTVETEIENKVDLLNIGADDYLTKPFSFRELFARIKALLRRPQISTPDILGIDDLVLNDKKQKVTRAGKEINLTPIEFKLLKYLVQHQGETVPKIDILEHVWDAEANFFSKSLETHILNLRKKIDKQNSKPLLHTKFGRGYKIG